MVMFINAYCVPNLFSTKIVIISEHPIMKSFRGNTVTVKKNVVSTAGETRIYRRP